MPLIQIKVRTIFTEEECKRLYAKPAAYVFRDTELRQMLITQNKLFERLEIPLGPSLWLAN